MWKQTIIQYPYINIAKFKENQLWRMISVIFGLRAPKFRTMTYVVIDEVYVRVWIRTVIYFWFLAVKRRENELFWPGGNGHLQHCAKLPCHLQSTRRNSSCNVVLITKWQNSITAPWLSVLSFNRHFMTTFDYFNLLRQNGPKEKIYNRKTNQKLKKNQTL
jgi:hypothetical protein